MRAEDFPERYQQQIAAARGDWHALPDVESSPGALPAPADEAQAPVPQCLPSGPVVIRVISYRKRLADPDNLAAKWYIDDFIKLLGLPDDCLKHVRRVEFEQVKIKAPEKERTLIEAWS